ncbi:hypothetical protein CBS101457_002375 [Exobasidium rhododendri]|nr:hypothetical protein CBS101457_002375 [Exobasidium rhododendri]
MPALLLSDETSATLRDLAERGDQNAAAIKLLKAELSKPPQAEQEGSTSAVSRAVVNHQCLIQIAKWAASSDLQPLRRDLELSRLLKGAQVAVAKKEQLARSPELLKTLRRIQLAQEEAEYEEMISSTRLSRTKEGKPFGFRTTAEKQSPWQTKENRSEAEEWEEVKRQLGAIANVALSVAAVVVSVWWAGGNADPVWKTLVALPLSILVAVAEVTLYARHWNNIQDKKKKGKVDKTSVK